MKTPALKLFEYTLHPKALNCSSFTFQFERMIRFVGNQQRVSK